MRMAWNSLYSRDSLAGSRSCLVALGYGESRKFRCTRSRPGRNVRNLLGSRSISLVVWSREDSSSCADCTKSASLADVVGEWLEICSVREQFLLFVWKRLTKTTVSLKVNRHFVNCIIAVWTTRRAYHTSNVTQHHMAWTPIVRELFIQW